MRCQATLRQLGKEQLYMSTDGFPITARSATARRHKEAFCGFCQIENNTWQLLRTQFKKKRKKSKEKKALTLKCGACVCVYLYVYYLKTHKPT